MCTDALRTRWGSERDEVRSATDTGHRQRRRSVVIAGAWAALGVVRCVSSALGCRTTSPRTLGHRPGLRHAPLAPRSQHAR